MKKAALIKHQSFRDSKIQRKIKFCLLFFATLFLCYFVSLANVEAQTFSLDPSSASKAVGQEFTVDLNINTNEKAVAGADVKLTFDAEVMEVVKVANGDFFTEEVDNIGSGTLYIGGLFREQFATKTGSGKVAVLTLKGKKAGSTQLVFVCTTQTNDSNIIDASAADIINCTGIKNGTYTFSGSGATTTVTPTTAPPVSGISWPTVFSLGAGALLTILGLVIIF